MKKLLIVLFFSPIYIFGQQPNIDEYYADGKKVKKSSWTEGDYVKTIIETKEGNTTSYRYYVSSNGIEVGTSFSVINEYGKYFKIDVSIVNNSTKRFDFLTDNIIIKLKGDIKDIEKYKKLNYEEYKEKVTKSQKSNEFWTALSLGISNGLSTTNYSQSNTNYNGKFGSGTITTNTTYYSPTLTNIQFQQTQKTLNELEESQSKQMQYINEGYLKNNTIFPNNTLVGYFLIPFNKKITEKNISIVIDKMIFHFKE
jgi:hypothetical protein